MGMYCVCACVCVCVCVCDQAAGCCVIYTCFAFFHFGGLLLSLLFSLPTCFQKINKFIHTYIKNL